MDTYRILILGSTGAAQSNTSSAGEFPPGPLATAVRPFAEAADSFIASLKTPVDGKVLKDLDVDAVSLASRALLANGTDGLESTIDSLAAVGVQSFGAGSSLDEARFPHRVTLPDYLGGGEIQLHTSLQRLRGRGQENEVFAGADIPGAAPLGVSTAAPARSDAPEDSLQIALPGWGEQGGWRSHPQFKLAHRLLKKDYDLVIGHGTGSLQEVHRKQQRWVVYGLGNGLSQSDHSESATEDLASEIPFSFWSMLEVHREGDRRWVELKLYPVSTDSGAESTPGPVGQEDFNCVISALTSRPDRPWRFNNPAMSTGSDDLGRFITLEVGDWPIGEAPARLQPTLEHEDAGDWPLRSPGVEIEDKILGLNKQLGAAMLAMAAEDEGGTVHWLSRDLALIEAAGKRLLTFRYRNHESSLGAVLVGDKVVTARVLKEAGVPTPETFLVTSPEGAVEAAHQISGPVVVKPRYGVKSMGVSIGLVADEEVWEAFAFAKANGSQVILQPHIDFSEELRVMASPEQAMAVNGRALPHVIGDGSSTIAQLIADKNLQRTLNPSLEERPIPTDALTHRRLERLGLTIDHVPQLGTHITVRNVAGLSVGGDTIQALDETSDEIKDAAAGAVAAIPGLGWGGADVIIENGTQRPYVIEINTQAAYGAALFPAYGGPKDVGTEAWRLRFEATALEIDTSPQVCSAVNTPAPIIQNQALAAKRPSVLFRQVFLDALKRLPYDVKRLSLKVRQVTTARGRVLVTRGGLTAADRFVVERVLKRHEWVSRILGLRDIPRPAHRPITSAAQLRRFLEEHPGEVSLRPADAIWRDPDEHRMSSEEALKSPGHGRRWIQGHPEGPRLRVLATREKAWVVTANQDQHPVNASQIDAAGRLAVEAVRAVPELRWAAVDLVLATASSGGDGKLLVEGLTNVPSYTLQDNVVAGDFDTFCGWIVEADDVPLSEMPDTRG